MLKHAGAILKLALALAALIAGAGVGYYYAIFLPGHHERLAERETATAQARSGADIEAREDEARRRRARAEAARVEYQDCLNFAKLSYKQRWTASCRAMHAADVAAYDDCADDLFSTEEACRERHPIRPERGCALPSRIADRLSGDRDRRKQECLGKLEGPQPPVSPDEAYDGPGEEPGSAL